MNYLASEQVNSVSPNVLYIMNDNKCAVRDSRLNVTVHTVEHPYYEMYCV